MNFIKQKGLKMHLHNRQLFKFRWLQLVCLNYKVSP